MMMMTSWRAASNAEEDEKVYPSSYIPLMFLYSDYVLRWIMASYIEIDICASTYRHSYTMNFSFFSPTICLTRGRMSRLDSLAHTECVSLFSKISPRGFTIKFSYSISHAMHTPKIVFHCCSTFSQQLTSRFSKSRASPIFLLSNSHNRSSLIAARNFLLWFSFIYWVKEFYQFYDVQLQGAKVLVEINIWVEKSDFDVLIFTIFFFTISNLHLEFFPLILHLISISIYNIKKMW